MAYREGSELQLLELNRGTRKLTRMFNSLPNMPTFDLQVQTIGKDLLKGALGLQESLIELRKLQDLKTSSQMKDKRKLDLEGGKILAELTQDSKRYTFKNYEEEKHVGSRSWRSSNDELKKVIRESLYGQNLLSISSDDEKGSSGRSLRFSSSSTRNSASSESEERKSCNSSTTQHVKMKTPNLIARLMGLEGIPSEATQPADKKEKESEVVTNVELPKTKNLPELEQKSVPRKQTLSEMIEKENSETLIKSGHSEGRKFEVDDASTKVLKQERAQKVKMVFYHIIVNGAQELPKEVDSITDKSLPKTEGESLQMNEEAQMTMDLEAMPCFDSRDCQEDTPTDNSLRHEVATAVKLVPQCVIGNDSQDLPREVDKDTVQNLEKTKMDSLQQHRRPASNHRRQKKDAIKSTKRTDEGQKPGLNASNSIKPRDAKATATQMSPAKTLRTSPANPDKGLITAKNTVYAKSGAPQKHTTTSQMKTLPMHLSALTREKTGNQQAKRSTNTKPLKQKDGQTIYNSGKTDGASSSNIPLARMQSTKRRQWLKSTIKDNIRKDQKVIDAVMPPTIRVGHPRKAEQTIAKLPKEEVIVGNIYELGDLRSLLLNSKEVLVLAHKLYPDAQQTVDDEKEDLRRGKTSGDLYLACAEELITRQSYHLELSKHPMWRTGSGSLSTYASLDQLVAAISEGIRTFANYSKVDDNAIFKDTFYVILEKDLKCNQMRLSATWDSGWWNGICTEEADQVVGQVEELISSELIEEVAVEMLY